LGGAFLGVLASRVFDPLWNPFRPEPEEVIKIMAAKMNGLKTLHAETEINIDVTAGVPGDTVETSLTVKSDIDKNNSKNAKSATKINLSAKGSALDTQEDYSLAVEIKTIGEDVYFKIDAPALSSLLSMFGVSPADFDNQWIKISKEAIEGITNQNQENLKTQEKLTKIIEQIISENKVYYIKKELEDEEVNGEKAYHYLLALDNKAVVKIISGIFESALEEQSKSNEPIQGFSSLGVDLSPTFLIGAMEGVLNKFFENVGEFTVDLWIGKKDNLLYKASLVKTIDIAKLAKSMSLGEDDIGNEAKGAILIKGDIGFSNLNEPVQIEAPNESKNFEEIVAAATLKFQQQTNDMNIGNNMTNLQNTAETIYQRYRSYYSFSCRNVTAKPFCDEIKKITGVSLVIKASKTKYCGYSKLATPNNYFCIDNTGYYEVDINPAGKGYCTGTTFICPDTNLPSP